MLTIYRGDQFPEIVVRMGYKSGQPFDFTGTTDIEVTIKAVDVIVTKSLLTVGVSNVMPGRFSLALTEADTLSLKVSEQARITIKVTKSNGEIRNAVVTGVKVRTV